MTYVMTACSDFETNHLMRYPSIHSPSRPLLHRMDDVDNVMILAIRSLPLTRDPPNTEKIECSMAEAMAATLRMGGYWKDVEDWQPAGIHWVVTCLARCRAIYRVCSWVVEVKAKMRVDVEAKMLESEVSLTHGRRNKLQLLGDGPCFISSSSPPPPPPMARACPAPHVESFPWSVFFSVRVGRRR